MSVVSALLVLSVFWIGLHVANYFFKPARAHSLLPTNVRDRSRRDSIWNNATTQLELKNVHLRVQTTKWNLSHDDLAATLRKSTLLEPLKQLYDLGSIIGVIGMLAAMGLLCWTTGTTVLALISKFFTKPIPLPSPDLLGEIYGRDLDSYRLEQQHALMENLSKTEPWIRPIIPGITVPMSHLPTILLAVFFSQIIHEFGHAAAAALESLPILGVGASLTLVIPSAFVSLPTAALSALPAKAKARIIAAGPFHNLLLWIILWLATQARLGSVLWAIGYRDVSNMGRVVVSVDSNSPMHGFLPTNSLITQLDDYPLGLNSSSSPTEEQDRWTAYLTAEKTSDVFNQTTLGWCAAHKESADLCCSMEASPGLSCFISTDSPPIRSCMDPIPLLSSTNEKVARCSSSADCPAQSTCVRPDKIERLLRLTIRRPYSKNLDVVLWSGPREEIWEEVHVSHLMPRIRILSASLPSFAKLFREYLQMATLSLFFFNLLPIPLLDGSHFLVAILQVYEGDRSRRLPDEYDLEAFGTNQAPLTQWNARWKRALTEVVPKLATVLLLLCTFIGILNASWT